MNKESTAQGNTVQAVWRACPDSPTGFTHDIYVNGKVYTRAVGLPLIADMIKRVRDTLKERARR